MRSSILAWRTPLPDREPWQATVHRVARSQTWPYRPWAHRCKTFFFACGSSAPVRVECEGGAAAWLQGPWWCQVYEITGCLHCRSHHPIRVFFWASFSWWSEGLFGQSFSIDPRVKALRRLPCLGSFFAVWCLSHIEGPLWSGTPICSQLVFHMHFCVWRCIPDVSMERDVLHVHLLLCHLGLQIFFFFKLVIVRSHFQWEGGLKKTLLPLPPAVFYWIDT